MFNLIWDTSLSEFQLLDEDYNLMSIDLSKENNLYKQMTVLLGDKILDDKVKNKYVLDIYEYIVEKVYSSERSDDHELYKFNQSLNASTKEKMITSLNVFLYKNMKRRLDKEVCIGYE